MTGKLQQPGRAETQMANTKFDLSLRRCARKKRQTTVSCLDSLAVELAQRESISPYERWWVDEGKLPNWDATAVMDAWCPRKVHAAERLCHRILA
jgi:hypothetical protein